MKIPDKGLYNGIFIEGVPNSMSEIEKLDKRVGKPFSTIMFYSNFSSAFPTEAVRNSISYGAIPHITWEPWGYGGMAISLQEVLDGKQDNYINTWIDDVKKVESPLFIRLGHEMNSNWYPWTADQNNKDPDMYIRFYKYVVDKFNKAGVENVSWVWCPNCDSVPAEEWNKYYKFYPGDEYVDWIGIDGYNWGGDSQSWSTWKSFKEVFGSIYGDITGRYPGKPIMIAEFASADTGGNKAIWITETYESIKKDFPRIKAVNWFNINKETDWRIDSSEECVTAYKKAISDEYFLQKAYGTK